MQRLIELKRRIGTVENIQTVARTLATVSSAKLSRTRGRAAGLRMYTDKMRNALREQQVYLMRCGIEPKDVSPFLTPRPRVTEVMLLHVAGDRGMCGNYNMAANRASLRFIGEQNAEGRRVSLVVKGEKGARYLRRRSDAPILHAEGWSRAGVLPEDVDRLYAMVCDAFLLGRADEVYATYTQFFSPLRRRVRIVRMLPVEPPSVDTPTDGHVERWSYEPDFGEVMDELLSTFLRAQVEDVLLQSYASEQGARMITMEEATERATKTLQECHLLYNRLRREAITTDLLGVLFASRLRESEPADMVRGGA